MITVDAHCDTISKAYQLNLSVKNTDGKTHIDLNGLNSIKPHIQFFAIYDESRNSDIHFFNTVRLIDYFYSEICSNNDIITLVKNKENLNSCISSKKTGVVLAIEGAYFLENNIHRLDLLYNLGVRCLSLVWNDGSSLCGGIGDSIDRGLSEIGKMAIIKMNKLNMLIDLSHISKRGFWDIIDMTERPVIATHSNCTSICDHPRNLNDSQIKAIGKSKGVIGINFVPKFLGKEKNNVSGIVDHIEHLVQIAGIDCIGLGSDFDGTEDLPQDIKKIEEINRIVDELLKRKFTSRDIEKIMGNNFLRVIKEIM